MAAQQKRMLTNPNSKLGREDMVVSLPIPFHLPTRKFPNRINQTILRKEDSWALLPAEIRQRLYELLPAPRDGEAPHNPDVHPLKTRYKPYIEEELRRWQEDLRDGREAKKWREEAMQAGRDRVRGKFDEWKETHREEYWGAPDENAEVKAESGEEVAASFEVVRVVRDSEGEE